MERLLILIQCRCGKLWDLDTEPTPEACVGEPWKLGTMVDSEMVWGPWIDAEGNEIS